jgi:hypothetical protein
MPPMNSCVEGELSSTKRLGTGREDTSFFTLALLISRLVREFRYQMHSELLNLTPCSLRSGECWRRRTAVSSKLPDFKGGPDPAYDPSICTMV